MSHRISMAKARQLYENEKKARENQKNDYISKRQKKYLMQLKKQKSFFNRLKKRLFQTGSNPICELHEKKIVYMDMTDDGKWFCPVCGVEK